MKILSISDLHSGQKILETMDLLFSKNKFDLVIVPGDITNPNLDALDYIKRLDSIFKSHDQRWLAVHGNNDRESVIEYMVNNHLNLHFEPQTIGGYHFVGIGGWADELPPYELKLDQKTIIVTHIPPKISNTNFLPEKSPLLHISGHHHDWERFRDLGPTRLINVPSVKFSNRAALITLPEKSINFFNLPTKPPLN